MSKSYNFKGFTLLEVAIVLAIVGLLLAGGVNLLSSSADTSKYKQTQNELQEIKEALLGLYVNKKFLPCPDTNNPPDGFGNYQGGTGGTTASDSNFLGAGGQCASSTGWLPYNDLGIGGNGDAWGERFKYVVSGDSSHFFTTATTDCNYTRPSAATSTTVRIQDLNTTANYIAEFTAFALISTGKNGRQTNSGMTGAFTNNGGCAGLDVREQENCDTDLTLRFGTQMSDGTTITFDDMVIWVGDYQLIGQLRKAGGCGASRGSGGGSAATDPTSRTNTAFTADPGKTTNNYNANDNIATSAAADKVIINQNQNKNLDLQDGDNTLDIGQNSNATVTSGAGNDVVRIQNNLNQPVNLGAGDDYLEVWGASNATINMGVGNDSVRIEGNVNQNVTLGSGTNSIYIGGVLNADITAVGGSAKVYLNSYTTLASVPAAIKGDSSLTLMCKSGASFVVCS